MLLPQSILNNHKQYWPQTVDAIQTLTTACNKLIPLSVSMIENIYYTYSIYIKHKFKKEGTMYSCPHFCQILWQCLMFLTHHMDVYDALNEGPCFYLRYPMVSYKLSYYY